MNSLSRNEHELYRVDTFEDSDKNEMNFVFGKEVENILNNTLIVRDRGASLIVAGHPGIGKSSFLEWAKWRIEDGMAMPTVKTEFFNDGAINFQKYQGLAKEMMFCKASGALEKFKNNTTVQSLLDPMAEAMKAVISLWFPAAKILTDAGIDGIKNILEGEPDDVSPKDIYSVFPKELRRIGQDFLKKPS